MRISCSNVDIIGKHTILPYYNFRSWLCHCKVYLFKRSTCSNLQASIIVFQPDRSTPVKSTARANVDLVTIPPDVKVYPIEDAPIPDMDLSLIHISEPTRRTPISYAV